MRDTTNTAVDNEEANKRLVEDLFDLWTNPDRAGERPYPPMFELHADPWYGKSDGVLTVILSKTAVDWKDVEVEVRGLVRYDGLDYHVAMSMPAEPPRKGAPEQATLFVFHEGQAAIYHVNSNGTHLFDTSGVEQEQILAGVGVARAELWAQFAATQLPTMCACAQRYRQGPTLVHIDHRS